jgi:long-chain acyl-CoA synthetase
MAQFSPDATVYEAIRQVAEKRKDQVFCVERKRFRRIEWTYGELLERSEQVAALLRMHGLRKGDRVGICAPNGPWWLAVFIAGAKLGLPIVPIDVNSSEEFISTVAQKTEMRVLFKTVYKPFEGNGLQVFELEQLVESLPAGEPVEAEEVRASDILEIVFTSGSTGDPKGVVLSHGNVLSNVQAVGKVWPIGGNHRLLSMIPLSHMFEQTVGFLIPFISGSQVVYVQSVRPFQVIQALQGEEITTIVTVPAFLSLLRRRIIEQAQAQHFWGQLRAELRLARFLPRPMRRYIFQGILMKLGPNLKLVAVGGAPLAGELETFWETLGISVVQGYGLTETSPIATYSSPRGKRPGSVGRCLPDQRLELAEDNEILLAGKNVFQGYFNNPEETAKTLQNGWYHTGDIGRIDKDGYVYITGRKKNMLLSESGLNVYPEDIETELANHTSIRDSVVMLYPIEGKEVLTAVVLTDATADRLAGIVREVNTSLGSHQAIQHTIIWPETDFPRTPTRKVKRQVIIDQLVGGAAAKSSAAPAADKGTVDQLRLLIAGVGGIPPAQVLPGANLVGDLGYDSLKRLELVSKVEEEMGAYIDEAAITGSTTVADLKELAARAAHSPKPRLFAFPFFESYPITILRMILGWPLLLVASYFQKLESDALPRLDGPVVYVANHSSHFDALTIMRLLSLRHRRKIVIGAAKDYFFKSRLQAFLLRFVLPLVPVDRDGNIQHTLQQLGGYLDAGFSVVLFPEGTRSTTGNLLPFKPGIGVIAQELEVSVVPLKFIGNDKIMPKGRTIPKRGTTIVKVGGPLVFGRDGDYRQATQVIEAAVKEL